MSQLGPVIYVVRTLDGLIKIGHTTNLYSRIRAYTKDAELLCILPGSRENEAAIHSRFRQHCARGKEYYRENDEIDDWIDAQRYKLGLRSMTRAGQAPKRKTFSRSQNINQHHYYYAPDRIPDRARS